LDQPLSLWGGMDPATGRVIDRRHPQVGEDLAGRVVFMPSGRGSSSSSSVLAEAIRSGTAPAAVVLLEPDGVLALGALVGAELYGRAVPVVVLDRSDYHDIRSGDDVLVEATERSATVRVVGQRD
jgi:predicted aconitase with swiveling domain